MVIPPKYTLTGSMLGSFAKVEANRLLLQQMTIPRQVIDNIQRQSLLKSSLFSAKIEGNMLTLTQVEKLSEKDAHTKDRLEIANILHAFAYLQERSLDKNIDRDFILGLHAKTMKGLITVENLGKLRKEPSAIFNQEGFAVYVPPPPSEIPVLLEQLIQFINTDQESNIPIRAILAHVVFEKIHPFLDGNGRVGRLLMQSILAKGLYHFNWLLSFEEVLNEKKASYYAYLDSTDTTAFIEFMLDVIVKASEQVTSLVSRKDFDKEDLLLPRRKEILLIVREQQLVSLDAIKRRFLKVPGRTLRYDLKQLEKEGFINKIGTTRGAMYKAKAV